MSVGNGIIIWTSLIKMIDEFPCSVHSTVQKVLRWYLLTLEKNKKIKKLKSLFFLYPLEIFANSLPPPHAVIDCTHTICLLMPHLIIEL